MRAARRRIRCSSVGGAALALAIIAIPSAADDNPSQLVERYAAQALHDDAAFAGFSAERGREFYFAKHVLTGVGAVSCSSCHLEDPRLPIRAHRAEVLCRACHVISDAEHPDPEHAKKRHIQPFAPAFNPERFRDFDKVERYFEVNCRLVLKRACATIEKGDLIVWLLTLQ